MFHYLVLFCTTIDIALYLKNSHDN